ncbi:MAG: hypothetical protein GY804_04955 [Alphaproteobacteria bacterium]|nr:hypothetical protein [Alphaproteobacteria bacterium]
MQLASPSQIMNPIDVIEDIAIGRNWTIDRIAKNEATIDLPDNEGGFAFFFAWSEHLEALHLSCSLSDLPIKDTDLPKVYEILATVNEKMWMGHFNFWKEEKVIMFRNSSLIETDKHEQLKMSELVEIALDECNRFKPIFDLTLKYGMDTNEAIKCALLDPIGEA